MSVATTSWKYEPFDSCVWKRSEAMTVLPAANVPPLSKSLFPFCFSVFFFIYYQGFLCVLIHD